MKKANLLIAILAFWFIGARVHAQTLTCNDLVFIALDENCTHTIIPDEILEGTIYTDCVVELDKTLPYGNGPWVAGVLGASDINKTYQVRVRHLPSGNACWGQVKAEDKLPPVLKCSGASVVTLSGTQATVPVTSLSLTGTDPCGATTLSPASLQFDCGDLGVNIVQVNATDAYGNSSHCSHTIVVNGAASDCLFCVDQCPASVTVSYDEGNNTLLPAFQTNNLGVFDPFGNALYSPLCLYSDSTYTVNYQVGPAGQSWFQRTWEWTDGTNPISCSQYILFPTNNIVTVQGKVFVDADGDCAPDAGEQGVKLFPLQLTTSPSGATTTIYPDASGNYSTEILFNVQDVGAELHLVLPAGVNTLCPNSLSIPNSTTTTSYQFDIGLQSDGNCPEMQVDLGTLFMRRCASNSFVINYCNNGLDTAYNAYVELNLDPLIHMQSATAPYTVAGPDSIYTFQLGNVPPFFCGTIFVTAHVACNAPLGQTLCNEASIFPNVPCSGIWQGAELTATAECSGDSVSLSLKNFGLQGMAAPLDYIVVEDFIMFQKAPFQLNAGESITIKTPANGATWRIESNQPQGYPIAGLVAAAIEGCGGINTPGVINAFGQSDNSQYYDIECDEVIGSYDPNDKTAIPTGISDEHFIRANEPIEYKIRFQNTGTDTAFKVVIVDTLSALLDARTLEAGSSSHPYQLKIFPGNVIQFVFDPIALPDSNVNELGSHGFVEFRIAQQPDLPDGSFIENTAAIYFDHNDPVITNTAFHTVGYPLVEVPPLNYSAMAISPTCHGDSNGSIQIQVSGGLPPYTYQWSNPSLQGENLSGLPAGVYELTVTDSRGVQTTGIFELTEPNPISLTMTSTPATGSQSDGSASVIPTGGTGAFSYLWNNGEISQTINGLAAGFYAVTATDANGCTQSNQVEVEALIPPLTILLQNSHPLCFGDATGSITVNIISGQAPYTYQWSNPSWQGNSQTGLPAGAYGVTVTDANGNQAEETAVLFDPAPIIITLTAGPANGTQNNGSVSATVTGGAGALAFLWSNGANTQNINSLPAGLYTVTVTDANGCTQTSSAEVQQQVSTGEASGLESIRIWPNPAHEQIMLDLRSALPNVLRMEILAADGRVLQQFREKDLQSVTTINLAGMHAAGLVTVVLHGRDGSVYSEIVVVQ